MAHARTLDGCVDAGILVDLLITDMPASQAASQPASQAASQPGSQPARQPGSQPARQPGRQGSSLM